MNKIPKSTKQLQILKKKFKHLFIFDTSNRPTNKQHLIFHRTFKKKKKKMIERQAREEISNTVRKQEEIICLRSDQAVKSRFSLPITTCVNQR